MSIRLSSGSREGSHGLRKIFVTTADNFYMQFYFMKMFAVVFFNHEFLQAGKGRKRKNVGINNL